MKRAINRPLEIPDEGRILVRVNNWIGDVVTSTPALHTLRTAFPRATISALAKPWVVPILQYSPDVDRILVYDANERHHGLTGKARLAVDLRRQRFHTAILFQRAFEAAAISFASCIPNRAGYCTDGRSLLLTHRIQAEEAVFRLHRVDHNLEMLARMGIQISEKPLALPVGKKELERSGEFLREIGAGPDTRLFGLNPGAAFGTAKRWVPERFASLSDRISKHVGGMGLLFGSAREHELGERISGAAEAASLRNLAGATTLAEAIALIGLCGLFVTNDSGLMHVAAALDVPLIALFGPTDPNTTSPWCQRHRLLRMEGLYCSPCMQRECGEGHHLCMEGISTEDVFDACSELLGDEDFDSVEERQQRLVVSPEPVPVVRPAGVRSGA